MGAGVSPEVEALWRLKLCRGLGDGGISALVKRHGSGVAALRAARAQGHLFPSGDAEPEVPPAPREDVQVVPMTSPAYPAALRELPDPPPLLFLKGRRALLEGPAVAVVGARRATEGGRRTAETLGRVLGGAGITVVSGMALGIDGAAHRGALAAGGRTVAVLGSGLGVVYPAAHRGLFRALASRGLLVSEFLPDQVALPHHFPRRNRVIAALADAIVVVEAGERSGALITVDHGLDLGREILAVPGSVESPQARGTNALIRDGARVVCSPESVLDEIPQLAAAGRRILERAAESGTRGSGEPPPQEADTTRLPPNLRKVWKALGRDPRDLDRISREAGTPPAETLAGLSALEVMGRATRCPGMRFRRE